MQYLRFHIFILLLFSISTVHSQNSWSFEFHGGAPYNPVLPLTIKQNGFEDLKLSARFKTEPFTPPIFWVWRIGKWKNEKGWELEAIHLKLYLQNPPEEIQEFSISHGYNIVTINRAIKKNFKNKINYIIRIGGGCVLSHPENTIRNQHFSPHNGILELGYYITGPALNLSLGHRINVTKFLSINTEIKFNPSYSVVPISNGKAYLWNLPVSLIAGIGVNL